MIQYFRKGERNLNRQEILNKFANEDDKLLVSKLLDKIEFTTKRNTVEHTDFLDIAVEGFAADFQPVAALFVAWA